MEERSHVSPLRRWLESLLVWYVLFMNLYLLLRFVIPTGWRFIDFLNNFAPYLVGLIFVGFAISLLLRRARIFGMYLLATLVGVLWIIPPLLPSFDITEANGTAIEIATINLEPADDTPLDTLDWANRYAPKILALQELPEDRTVIDGLEDVYPYSAQQDGLLDLALYSHYPILSADGIDLGQTTAQRVLLDINGNEVALYNVHIFAPFNDRETDWLALRYDESRRNAEIRQLLEAIETETVPVILAGVFNMTEWSPIYGRITQTLQDAYRQGSWGIGSTFPSDSTTSVSRGFPRLLRIDYIFYTEPLTTDFAVVSTSVGSDHLPLRSRLYLP